MLQNLQDLVRTIGADITPEQVVKASSAAVLLWGWVRAVFSFAVDGLGFRGALLKPSSWFSLISWLASAGRTAPPSALGGLNDRVATLYATRAAGSTVEQDEY